MFLFQKVFRLCPLSLKNKFWWLLVGMLLLAIGETVSVGLLAFYAAAVSDPQSTWQAVADHPYLSIVPSTIQPILSSPKALIGGLSILVILSVVLKNIYRGVVTYKMAHFGALVEAFFGQRLLESFLNRDYRWHLQENSADLIQLVQWRTHIGRNFITPHLKMLCEFSMLFVLLGALLWVQPLVSLFFIFIQGGAGFVVYRFLRKGLDRSAKGCRQCDVELNRNVTRSIHGVKDVKITGTSAFFMRGFSGRAAAFARMFGQQQFWRESPLLILETLGFTIIAGAILLMLFGLGYSPLQTTGTTALLAVTAWRTLPAFNRVVSSLAGIRTAQPFVESFLEAFPNLLLQNNVANNTVKFKPVSFERTIEFQNLSFSYDGTMPVIQSLNLTINRGQSLGIMGPSGCGKSTFVDLLTGLLQADSGKILIDGVELNVENCADWQRNIGYVPQFPYIFDGSLAENIAFGQPLQDIDRGQVNTVCSMAAIDFLDQLPDGIDSMIGERGVRLSGGQRQRVAIARALYRQPGVIIFDEATSALDEDKDFEIRQLISQLKGKQTLVVVSHRPSTVADCDVVVQLSAEMSDGDN